MDKNVPPPSGQQPRPAQLLNPVELSRRWQLSPNTLARWRWLRQNVGWVRIGGKVLYRLEDVEAFERDNLHLTKAESGGRK